MSRLGAISRWVGTWCRLGWGWEWGCWHPRAQASQHALRGVQLRAGAPPRRGRAKHRGATCGCVRFVRGARAPRVSHQAGRTGYRLLIWWAHATYLTSNDGELGRERRGV